jgi:hypothetical protein
MQTWLSKIYARQEGRTLRDWGLPEIVVEALETIAAIYAELRADDRIERLTEYYPHQSRKPRDFTECMPPYWEIKLPPGTPWDLEIAYRDEEQRLAAEAARDERIRQLRETHALYKVARAAHDRIAPIFHAEERLRDEFARLALSGRALTDPECLKALLSFRDSLALYCTPVAKPAVEAYLFKLDQSIDRVRDELRRIVLRQLAEGAIVGEQRREWIALLEADAANGTWPDPEADMAWAERAAMGAA